MKKLWKKFKTWLIIKLGGHPTEKTVEIVHTIVPVCSYTVTLKLDPRHPKFGDEEFIKEYLAKECLGIVEQHLEIRSCEDIFDMYPGTRTYEGTIRLGEKRK